MSDKYYYVYILTCMDKDNVITYYTGQTSNMNKRYWQHVKGKGARYTKGRSILAVWYKRVNSRSEAMKREREIKKLSHAEKRKILEGRA